MKIRASRGRRVLASGAAARMSTALWGITNSGWRRRAMTRHQYESAGGSQRDPPSILRLQQNPAVTTPDQVARCAASSERPFTVVQQVMTHTACYADAAVNTTFLEGYDLVKSYGPWTLGLGRRLSNSGRIAPNADLRGIADLTDSQGRRPAQSPKRCHVRARRTTGDEVRESARRPTVRRTPHPVRDVFPRTADQRIHLYPEALAGGGSGLYTYQPDPDPRFPSPSSRRQAMGISSTLAEFRVLKSAC